MARRGGRPLLWIVLLTEVLPTAAVGLAMLPLQPRPPAVSPSGEPLPGELQGFWGDLLLLVGIVLAVGLVAGLVQCLGWAAGTWVITRQATGQEVALGAALRYGLRRAPGLFGWSLLAGLLVLAGLCACFLPGVYLAFATSLVGPIYLFERRNPIGRTFQLAHARFGMVLGRVAAVAAVVLGGGLVLAVLESIVTLGPAAATPGEMFAPPAVSAVSVVSTLVSSVLGAPLQLALLVGILVTYTEQRGHEAPVNSARLAAELS
ncbi:hypothetical protein O7626_37300 [Micromonospora sp. WMMD1102]|uniref:hypothetical protein n=1 Tax=Micromonospora sp. WMMD1102 TaxID=3016105 RepID=UPI002414EBDB|nr:hypothetical protein [Micromonospora sp. WMMD1102]MDG4791488.1 hypothetical protein [Micromonospora sp. WMMD1102]